MSDLKLKTVALVALLLLVPILLAGCGDDATGLTREEVQEIVRSEMAASAPAPAQPSLTREEVQEIVRSEAAASAPAPAQPSLTREEVQEIVRSEAAASAPAPAQPSLTREEVEVAIQAAIAAIPQPEPGLTSPKVEELIRAAIADLAKPDVGITADEARRLAQYAVATVPPKTSPAEYTKFFVSNAISRYETEGREATLAHYNRVESIDGQWYVFIVDVNDLVIAHPEVSLVGLDLKGPLGTDANGYNFGPEMLLATEEGKWVSYVYRNPETRNIGSDFGESQLKNAWVVSHDGLLFGSGWYVDADEFTKSFVAAGVSKFRSVGLEGTVEYFTGSESDFSGLAAAIDYYNSIETVDGNWSAFIVDGSGKIVDHYDKELV